MSSLQASELILDTNNRLYHIRLKDEDIANTILLVGDQNRVKEISKHFSKIRYTSAHREFIAHTGTYKNSELTVLSTGIGTDNIDIVLNELDAAVNIDPKNKQIKTNKRQLNLIRLGTSGALQENIQINDLVCSSYGLGLDGLLNFYKNWESVNQTDISEAYIKHCRWPSNLAYPYCVAANETLFNVFKNEMHTGITATAPGFYAPQNRNLRTQSAIPDLNNLLTSFSVNELRITNFEMETSALYGLGALLGHRCLTICVIIANRIRKEFSKDSEKSVALMIEKTLDKIASIQ